jgi:hypothetical protein
MTRLTVNHCWILDMSQLLRTGAIVPGVAKTGMRFELDGIPGYSSHLRYVRINSWYPARGDAGMQVFFSDGSTDIIYFRCNDGGVAKRWFFVVAAHGREDGLVFVRKLYLPPGKHSFDTRQAHNIPYPGRNLSKPDRLKRQIHKLRAKLGISDDISIWSGPASKPPGMHTKTFIRCAAKLEELQWRLIEGTRPRGRPSKWFQSLGIGTMPRRRLGANRRSTGRVDPPRKGKMNAGDKAAIARAAASSPGPFSRPARSA